MCIHALVCSRVTLSPVLQELKELLSAALLKQTHERALYRLHFRARYFGNLAITIDETTCNLLELEVTCNLGMHENLCKFSRCDDEFGDKVDSVIPVATKLCWWCLIRSELPIELLGVVPYQSLEYIDTELLYLCQVKTRAIATVIIISIHM